MRSALLRRADAIALVLLVLTVVVVGAAIWMDARYHPGEDAQLAQRTAELAAWGLTGSVLLARRPDLTFGWIFALGALVEVAYLTIGVPAAIAFQHGHGTPALLWAYSLSGIQWIPAALTGVIFCRFPSGHPSARRWALLDRALRCGIVVTALAGILEDWSGKESIGDTQRFVDRTPIPALASDLLVVLPILILLSAVAGISVVVRWHRARGLERRQLAWMAGGAAIVLLGWPLAASERVPTWVVVAQEFVVPVALLVPVLRYGLWAIDSIVRRSAIYHLRGGGTIDGIVHAAADLLKLPYVAVQHNAAVLASAGERPARVESWPIVHDGQRLGELVAAARFGRSGISANDRDVLASTAELVGGSLRADALTGELLEARQRLVTAREEERRRLRRDLHDGIGPMLTGLGLHLDAARADPERAAAHLAHAKAASGEMLRSLRELVDGLRPPALDDLGLAGALRLQVAHLARDLDARVSAPDSGTLPAAVEVAALRTAVEAVNNTVRHATATTVDVVVEALDSVLVVTVTDDGGPRVWGVDGVGLASMRERAEELGGTLEAGPTPDGGRVRATYPLAGDS